MTGRAMQPKGGYDKEKSGLSWVEHPHPHWHLCCLAPRTRLRNGRIVLNDRIALTFEGPSIVLENVTIEGVYMVCASGAQCSSSIYGLLAVAQNGQPAHFEEPSGLSVHQAISLKAIFKRRAPRSECAVDVNTP
jgi:hypothetical protein